ncbi:ImmA/IrrE family metallo-endopeptidase [Kocuria sp.]|uniref:ImmA/IrrE family metallo-endopeptidase n=1 Tax=Kocuria sp. TaxID=1871328 RepID=UPI0026DB8C38|nr:ImmA/IrrE family metallo-endopeptidase [Kocuria sp.]MDO4920079.1 ImmA/IrrE family metallo-endopeptidase [Kocuria sp.]
MPTEGATTDKIRQEARNAAADALESAWAGGYPIDPVQIARELGVSVFSAQLGDETWGMIIGGSNGADIYLDVDQPPKRYRFSCAHELGHFVDRQSNLAPGTGYVDSRSSAGHGLPIEVYANEFAASLLMPEDHFRKKCQEGLTDFALTNYFDVSLQAVQLRKQHLKIGG